jgi:hypothetical protein
MTIAGHSFSPEGLCTCGRRFGDISGAGPEHLNKPHWAHQGNLIERELEEIQAEVQRLWSLVVGAATGNGPAAAPAQEDVDYSGAEAA